MESSNSTRIARNTVFLYIRMFVSMAISLYTSRVVLNALGVEDYGIYGIIGSIVVLFSFLNSSMSASTSRFMTFEMGRRDAHRLTAVFNCALIIHVVLAVIVVVLLETLGIWFLNHKLVIPENRMLAATWVFHLSTAACALTIMQVPFSAAIISNERMGFYAYIDIIHSILKLGIVFLLGITAFDKLVFYAVLMLGVHLIVFSANTLYCQTKFPECKLDLRWNKKLGKSMLGFSAWTIYPNVCFTSRQQGTNFLLNIFGGTIVNAAAGIAATTLAVLEQFSNNVLMAARPQIIKRYAEGDTRSMADLLKQTSLIANLLFLIVAIPFVAEIKYVLKAWLIIVPPYTTGFCLALVIGAFISLNSNVIYISIQASGKMMLYSITAGTTSLMVLPVLYLIFHHGGSLLFAYIIPIASNSAIYLYCLYSLKKISPDISLRHYVWGTLFQSILCVLAAIGSLIVLHLYMPSSFLRLFISIFLSSVLIIGISYHFVLSQSVKQMIRSKIKEKFKP